MKTVICTALLAFSLGLGSAFAQAPATQPASPAKSSADKSAISKACSDQANAKGLHGKERKKFRSECKKNGGKAP
ncbi:MAG TPA: PsiF family protein [Xanthobacteraceae bacterium]|nr:PsiF family protein [Xanthobacteraceae bacterium]